MEKVRYHEMLPHEVRKRRAEFPVAFLPAGTLEWHGEHLAVGNDGLKAEALCELAARRSGGFAFPTMWYGEPRTWCQVEYGLDDPTPDAAPVRKRMGFQDRKFTAEHFKVAQAEQIKRFLDLMRYTFVQLNSLEMKAIVVLCGHYPLQWELPPVIEAFNRDYPDTQVAAGVESQYMEGHPDVGGDHAAKWETSYLWYLRPDCVDMAQFKEHPEDPLLGVGGEDPRNTASIEIGRKAIDLIVDAMIAKGRTLLLSAH